MSFPADCPKCQANYQAPEHLRNKPLCCRKCGHLYRPGKPVAKAPQPVSTVADHTENHSPPNPGNAPPIDRPPSSATNVPSAKPVAEPPPTPVVVELDDEVDEEAQAPRRRRKPRPITWQDLESRKRRPISQTDDADAPPEGPAKPQSRRSVPRPTLPRRSRRSVILAILAVLVISGGGWGIYWATRSDPAPEKPPAQDPVRRVEGPGPHTLAALGARFDIRPTALEGKSKTIELEGEVTDLCLGAGGRYIILHLPTRRQLAVVDVNTAVVVKSIPVADGALFTAGAEHLLICQNGNLERWNLGKFQQEQQTAIPGRVSAIAMGHASRGPLLVDTINENGTTAKLRFFDANTLEETRVKPFEHDLAGNGVRAEFRVSADGTIFSWWSNELLPTQRGVGTLVDDGTGYRTNFLGAELGGPFPSADGRVLYGSLRRYFRNLQPISDPQAQMPAAMSPSTHGSYWVKVSLGPANPNMPHAVSIQTAANENVGLLELPATDEIPMPIAPVFPVQQTLSTDRQRFLIPAAKVLITVSPKEKRVVFHRCDIEATLAAREADYLVVTSIPPLFTVGQKFTYKPEVLSASPVEYKPIGGPEGMTITREGLIEWNVPDRWTGDTATAEIELSNEGKSIRHKLTLHRDIPGDGALNIPLQPKGLLPE